MRSSPVNGALRAPRLTYGVETKALGLIWGPMAFVAVIIGTSVGWTYAVIPMVVAALIHAGIRWAYKKDLYIFQIYGRYANLFGSYQPHPREELPDPFKRPAKVARGLRL